MRIARLSLKNWSCFGGQNVLDLGPKAYAVIARAAEDPDRSNWIGKSSLLEAITFALYGRHRYRTEDDFITRGEEHCEVEVELDGGTRILRTRERGKTTRLYFYAVDSKKQAMKQEAQELIEQLLGLTEEDFVNTCAFEQRQMAKMILARPEARMEIISAWLRLGPLETCADKVGESVSKRSMVAEELRSSIRGHEEALKQMPPADEANVANWRATVARRRSEIEVLQDDVQRNAVLLSARSRIEDFDRVIAEGGRLKDELATNNPRALATEHEVAQHAWREAGTKVQFAQRELKAKRELALGQFDGTCPVAGIDCPAKDRINGLRKENAKLFREADAEFKQAEEEHTAALRRFRSSEGVHQEAERRQQRLDLLRERAAQMMPEVEAAKAAGAPEDQQLLRLRLEAAQGRLAEALSAQAAVVQAAEARKRTEVILERLRGELAQQEGGIAIWREAGTIFKRARQKVAEDSLAEIEDGANRMLGECAIDLRVGVQWSREGSGLARACDGCGSPYPTSVKVKSCQRCGAARGPQMVNKLEIVLSDRSGAAEDLAGAAIQLSASAWLRNDRGSSWETALLDEPMSQLDRANRRAFGAHLMTMLSGYGFNQSFVIAHSPDFLDALPARILIESKNGRSSVRVVA